MILSDRSIREALAADRIVIDPFDESCLQPSSVDVRLDSHFRAFRRHPAERIIDPKMEQPDLTESVYVAAGDHFTLYPGEFALGSTMELVGLPDDMVCRIEGKSSLGRLGLIIHSTAGFIDPGFVGHITLELACLAPVPIMLYPGMRIGQISFMRMTTKADHPYGTSGLGSKYQGQNGPTPSRYFQNFS